jgi:hypothetical protein
MLLQWWYSNGIQRKLSKRQNRFSMMKATDRERERERERERDRDRQTDRQIEERTQLDNADGNMSHLTFSGLLRALYDKKWRDSGADTHHQSSPTTLHFSSLCSLKLPLPPPPKPTFPPDIYQNV